MKKILKTGCAAGIAMMMASAAVADLVYSTDFSTGYVAGGGGSGAFVLGGATPDVSTNDWFGSTNGAGITGGDLTLDNASQQRYRGAGVWLDTTGWATGLVTVEVDVANYVAGANSRLLFQAYSATGVDALNSVSLDLHGSGTGGAVLAQTGTAAISALGSEQLITANGTDIPFTFAYNGTDDFVGLVFAINNDPGTTTFSSGDIDNLTVNTIPEPSILALLGMGLGVIMLTRRKLRG